MYLLSYVVEMIRWLMGWPAGFKLNSNLDRFLGEVFLWMLSIWSGKRLHNYLGHAGFNVALCPFLLNNIVYDAYLVGILNFVVPMSRLPILWVSTYLGVFGATFLLSFFMDLMLWITFPVSLFYMISSKLYYSWMTCFISLFRLFRGLRKNILRNRVDHCDYGNACPSG